MDRQSISSRLDELNADLDRVMNDLDVFLVQNGVNTNAMETISNLVDRTYDEIASGLVDAGHSVVRDRDYREEEEGKEEIIPDDESESYSVHAPSSVDDDETIELPPRHLRLSLDSDVSCSTVDIYTYTPNTIRQLEWLAGVEAIGNGLDTDQDDIFADDETWVLEDWEAPYVTPN